MTRILLHPLGVVLLGYLMLSNSDFRGSQDKPAGDEEVTMEQGPDDASGDDANSDTETQTGTPADDRAETAGDELPLMQEDPLQSIAPPPAGGAAAMAPADQSLAGAVQRLIELQTLLEQDLSDEDLVRVRDELLALRATLAGEKVFTEAAADCPAVPDCRSRDATIYIKLPAVGNQDAAFTASGVFAFNSIMSGAMARGFENATIRAMNATQACPDCKKQDENENQ